MRLTEPIEVMYLTLMIRWENTAPPDGKQGLLDDEPERNTQISRMVYLLRKIAAGAEEKIYNTLSTFSSRNDGESYISMNHSWMEDPRELGAGWYFEGCTSLVQKQNILQALSKLGLSGTFVNCADDFVAGKGIQKYFPTEEENDIILVRIKELEDKK